MIAISNSYGLPLLFYERDDVSKTNVAEGYVNYQPDPYDDQFDAWQRANTETQVVNDNPMAQGQEERFYDSYERRRY